MLIVFFRDTLAEYRKYERVLRHIVRAFGPKPRRETEGERWQRVGRGVGPLRAKAESG